MTTILRTTLATAFAAACIAGASVSFAANNDKGGNQGNTDGHQTMSRNSPDQQEKLDDATTGSISSCDTKESKQNAACFNGMPKMK